VHRRWLLLPPLRAKPGWVPQRRAKPKRAGLLRLQRRGGSFSSATGRQHNARGVNSRLNVTQEPACRRRQIPVPKYARKYDKYDEVLFLHIFGKYVLPTLLMTVCPAVNHRRLAGVPVTCDLKATIDRVTGSCRRVTSRLQRRTSLSHCTQAQCHGQ
jgi:hypothetical protein